MSNKIIISHSSIQAFHNCKRKFKHQYIDRLKSPTLPPNKCLSFGQSIHTALAKFNLLENIGDKTLENLHGLLRKNWIREGYESRDEERDFGLRALEMLKNFYHNPLDHGKRNLLIEEMVYLDIEGKFTLCGKLDKTYLRDDNAVETLDYKTGKYITPIDTLQLPIYLLLTKEKLGCFPDTVSYYFLAHNKKVSSEVTETYIREALDFLWEVSNRILEEKKYHCSPSSNCKSNCGYFHHCLEAKDLRLPHKKLYTN